MTIRIENRGPELSTSLALAREEATSAATNETPTAEGALDFGALLKGGLDESKRLHAEATAKAEALGRGASDDLHGTMITVKEAEISMKLVGSVRNRLLDAFHELWRINL